MMNQLKSIDVNSDFAAAKAALVDWFVLDAWRITNPRVLVQQVCSRFVEVGVPLETFTAFVRTLHPDYFGVQHRWNRETNDVSTVQGSHELFNTDLVQKSPIQLVYEGAAAYRCHLDAPDFTTEYPVLQDYADAGATDYVLMRMEFSDGAVQCVTMSSRQPGGFSVADLTLINDLLPYMARLTEIQAHRYLAMTLLDTYVGHDSGSQILVGNIRRGSGETIRAVIWFCDLRGFTELSDRLERDDLLALLNDYFDCVGKPVRARRGEILKFIGDAMLAIFPVPHTEDDPDACERAFAAAEEALDLSAQINQTRKQAGTPEIDFAIALHIGEVMYGNIGTGDRLDFTVIGPAVNVATRIEGLSKQLDRRILLSHDFADRYPGASVPLGAYELKGVAETQEVFGRAE